MYFVGGKLSMTENMKKFLELVSQNTELVAKIDAVDKATLIEIAKELGIDLTEADFAQQAIELSDDELDAVAGGNICACAMGGGGSAGGKDAVCVCVIGGGGESKGGSARCGCVLCGTGQSLNPDQAMKV